MGHFKSNQFLKFSFVLIGEGVKGLMLAIFLTVTVLYYKIKLNTIFDTSKKYKL
jgi:hypothetical protein